MPFLLVIPSIDIKDGKTVRVVQGIPELNVPQYGNDPVEMAAIWRSENARLLHIVDYDGFKSHSQRNFQILKTICESLIIPIEYTGGIRSLDDAKRIFDLGVLRISVSTIAIENRPEFEKVINRFHPSAVVVSLDVVDNLIMLRAQKRMTDRDAIETAKELKKIGVERFIINDVKRNGMLSGPNLALSKSIAEATECKITVAGGVRNKDELMDVQNLLPYGIDSVIIGRGLYENRFPCQKLWRLAESVSYL